jgi:hypothetical protein
VSINSSVKTSGTQPSGTRGTASRVCAICRRPLAADDRVMDIHDLSVHVGCAAYRRRRARR